MKSSLYPRKQPFPFYKSLMSLAASGFVLLPLLHSSSPVYSDTNLPGQVAPPLSHGSGVAVGTKVVLVARPLDSNRVVTSVRFLLDGTTLAEVGSPGRWLWDTTNIRSGRHVVQVQAFDHETFIGLSEPLVVYTGQSSSPAGLTPVMDVPFFTYEMDPRRAAGIIAPRIAVRAGASISEAGNTQSARLVAPLVEVYLNGIKQEFAPAARVATADELAAAGARTASVAAAFAPPAKPAKGAARTRSARRLQAQREQRERAEKKARLARLAAKETNRTVWLPARPLLERLGAHISWQPKSGVMVAQLSIAGAPRRIVLSARNSTAVQAEIAGQHLALTTPVRLAENTIMVPLSFCQDALDLRVRWQKDTRRVEMFTPIAPA